VSTLEVDALTVSLGETVALKDVTFTLKPGELLVVLGPTGAGKTTLLRAIAGLQQPDRGNITIEGQSVASAAPAERDVAMVFQNFSLYPDRTVRQNLSFPLTSPSSTVSAEEIDDRVRWAADLLHMTPLLDRPSTQLSGGEMQRVAIGRAIVRSPRIFLFDEPLTNLDAKLRERLRVELIALQKSLQTPTIYVTHDQSEALSMADRIIVLSDGEIAQTGPPDEVYGRPVSSDVALQLGYPPINLIRVRRFETSWTSPGGDPIAACSSAAETATLGIRPESVLPSGGEIPGTIQIVEDLGPSRILLVDWAGCHLHILVDKETSYRPGDTIFPRFSPDRLLVWPAG